MTTPEPAPPSTPVALAPSAFPPVGDVVTRSHVARALLILELSLDEIDDAKGVVSASTYGSLLAVRDLLAGGAS